MNQIQKTYIISKAAYDAAFQNENWELVEQLEDPFVTAEFSLLEWTFEEVKKTSQMPEKDLKFIWDNMSVEHMHKFAEMGARLQTNEGELLK